MKSILLVEDNKLERKAIFRLLNDHFNDTVTIDAVADGLEATLFLKKQAYDLVITDLILPKIEGIKLIQIIRNLYPETGIIAISGSLPYYLYMAKKLGVLAVYTKPIDPHKILPFVKKYLHLS